MTANSMLRRQPDGAVPHPEPFLVPRPASPSSISADQPTSSSTLEPPATSGAVTVLSPHLNVLAHVDLPSLSDRTGAGPSVRRLIEHLGRRSDIRLRILADRTDQEQLLPLLGEPWTGFAYSSYALDSSRQQARWVMLNRPRAEVFWPETQIVFSTADGYIPTRSARLIVSIHGSRLPKPYPGRRSFGLSCEHLRWRLLSSRIRTNAACVHTTSTAAAERLLGLVPELRDRVAVVPDGLAPEILNPVTPGARAWLDRLGLGDGRPAVLLRGDLQDHPGSPEPLSGVACWTSALRALGHGLPGLRLIAVDAIDPNLARTAREIAAGCSLDLRLLRAENWNVPYGPTPAEARRALLAAASLLWSPGADDGGGRMRLIEAMACGVPVVAGDYPANCEAGGGQLGMTALLVDPGDPELQVEAILSLLAGGDDCEERVVHGRQRAKGATWTATATAMKQVFHALL